MEELKHVLEQIRRGNYNQEALVRLHTGEEGHRRVIVDTILDTLANNKSTLLIENIRKYHSEFFESFMVQILLRGDIFQRANITIRNPSLTRLCFAAQRDDAITRGTIDELDFYYSLIVNELELDHYRDMFDRKKWYSQYGAHYFIRDLSEETLTDLLNRYSSMIEESVDLVNYMYAIYYYDNYIEPARKYIRNMDKTLISLSRHTDESALSFLQTFLSEGIYLNAWIDENYRLKYISDPTLLKSILKIGVDPKTFEMIDEIYNINPIILRRYLKIILKNPEQALRILRSDPNINNKDFRDLFNKY